MAQPATLLVDRTQQRGTGPGSAGRGGAAGRGGRRRRHGGRRSGGKDRDGSGRDEGAGLASEKFPAGGRSGTEPGQQGTSSGTGPGRGKRIVQGARRRRTTEAPDSALRRRTGEGPPTGKRSRRGSRSSATSGGQARVAAPSRGHRDERRRAPPAPSPVVVIPAFVVGNVERQRAHQVCRFFGTPAGCFRGRACKFEHSGSAGVAHDRGRGRGSGRDRGGTPLLGRQVARGGRDGARVPEDVDFSIAWHDADLRITYTSDSRRAADWVAAHIWAPLAMLEASATGGAGGSGGSQAARTLRVGMDVEWRPAFRPGETVPVAVVQLAAPSGDILVAQVLHMGAKAAWKIKQRAGIGAAIDAPPPGLKWLADVCENEQIHFCGVGIAPDAQKLDEELRVSVARVLDLGTCACRSSDPVLLGNLSLGKMADALLSAPRWKSKSLQMTNWEKPLNRRQLEYAALDAYVGLRLADRLSEMAAHDDGIVLDPLSPGVRLTCDECGRKCHLQGFSSHVAATGHCRAAAPVS